MRIRSPSLHELHAFAATARLGSFSKAAELLCVTQGAVSRAVARLEEHLGQSLLLRQPRGNELTPVGRSYLELIEPALQTLESAAVAQRAAEGPTRLRISVAPTLATKWLIPRLPDWQALHPQIALSLAPYRRDEDFGDPDVDAWLRPGEDLWPAAVTAEYIVGRDIVPICRPQELRGRQALREPADLLSRPLLYHSNYPDNWRQWLEAVGVLGAQLKPSADFEQVAMLVQAVVSGLGVAVVQRCLIDDELAAGRIVVPFEQPVQISRGYMLCTRRASQSQRALRSLRQWLLAQGS
ncbi:LysR substrate-binding domain-containing protein [Paucibacter sp. PLA-PC-4]|uniref:LysR substrate-binding domain-containing protein n=1 Tax=Paucibacter sp. PLA-PC-4 TaxID=2993655 RepID=UPI0022496BF5|nr:LysR substrate-binding domain-containing protein [Paucibacter sp. PLA-PC-4]MCX2863033.1 LysR substrate-binding domain-containing protein [Paucibacter sp. PLA-PC-4]